MKKLSLAFLAFVSAVFIACGDSKDSKDSQDSRKSQTINANDSQGKSNESSADSSANLGKSAQKDSPKDFIVDCDKCVIQVIATDDEINRFKKEWGEDDFYVIVDDEMWYAYKLDEYLLANGIKTEYISRDKVNYTKVVFSNESVDITRLDSLYNFYLYQKGKKPKELKDTVVFEDEVNAYFEIINPKYPQQESSVDSGESNNKSTQDFRKFTETLSDDYAKRVLDETKKYMSFIVSPEGFSALDALAYDSAKVQVDENNGLEFIDLCKHRVVDGVKYQGIFQGETYDSNCIVSDTQGEIDRIRKYFIKAKSIDEAFGLYYKTKDKAPKGNVYKDDGVSIYYIWENGRLWISSSGHNGGSATIFTQKGDFVEVIYRWSITG